MSRMRKTHVRFCESKEDGVAPHLLATRFGSCNCKMPTGRCDLDLVIQLLIKVQFDIINPNRPTGPRRNIYE